MVMRIWRENVLSYPETIFHNKKNRNLTEALSDSFHETQPNVNLIKSPEIWKSILWAIQFISESFSQKCVLACMQYISTAMGNKLPSFPLKWASVFICGLWSLASGMTNALFLSFFLIGSMEQHSFGNVQGYQGYQILECLCDSSLHTLTHTHTHTHIRTSGLPALLA